ncbi:MAG: hypothetical protein HYT79_05605 [Elusimicrobia bacterium]|nr:hypothetical protein [Elusimicrobiota bacterium]
MKLGFKDFFIKLDKLTPTVFYLTGPEEYLKLRAKERLLARPDCAGFARVRMQGRELDVQELWDSLNSPQLFSSGEIIIIEKVEKIKAADKRSMLEVLEAYFETEAAGKIVVMISEAQRMDVADPLEGFLLANPSAAHVFFPVLTEEDVVSWAKGELRRKNIEVGQESLERIARSYANELYSWANLIKNLELSLGSKKRAEPQDVEMLLADSSPKEDRLLDELSDTAYALLDRSRSAPACLGQALFLSDGLFAAGVEGPQAAALRLMRAFADAVYELGVAKSGTYSSRQKRDYNLGVRLKKAASLWSWESVRKLYSVLIDGEMDLKTGRLAPESAAKKFLMAFTDACVAGKSGASGSGGSRLFAAQGTH